MIQGLYILILILRKFFCSSNLPLRIRPRGFGAFYASRLRFECWAFTTAFKFRELFDFAVEA